jgi:glucokinase
MGINILKKQCGSALKTCVFTKSAERLIIEISSLQNSGILGAAALYYDAMK